MTSALINYSLGEVCRVINGRAYKQSELLDDGKYRVLRVGNFFSNNSWYYSDLELNEDKYCENGDLLFAWSASFGPRIWSKEKVIYHYHIWKMLPNEKIIDKTFLFYLLMSKTNSFMDSTHGSIMLHLTKTFIEELVLSFPKSLNIQKSISKVLSDLDAKIELNNKINAELEAMAKLIYDYWFVQFDFSDENGKPYKSSGGKMVYNEELKREIPEGWNVDSFSNWIANDKSGDWGKESEQGNYVNKVSCIRGADLNGLNGKGEVKSPVRYVLEKNRHKLLEIGDFIIEISGGSPVQSTGRMALITEETLQRFDNPLICSNFCKAVTLKDEKSIYNFAYEWNRLYDAGVLFGWEGKTSGIKNLLFDSFVTNHKVVLPSKESMELFYNKAKPIHAQIQKNLQQNQKLAELRDWLLPMLMNGQVIVN
jgi:type I restriction enzyme S subunit